RRGPGGAALVRVFPGERRIVRARIPRRTGQSKENDEHTRPREDRGSDLRGEDLDPARQPPSSRWHSRPAQPGSSKTNTAPPSGLEANIRSPVCPRKLGGVLSRPEMTATYCLPSSS